MTAPRIRFRAQRGVTLIELMIAVSLVAVISAGMLFATRTSLTSYERIDQKLRGQRASMHRAEILNRQLGALMPAMGSCGGPVFPLFQGTPDSLRTVSSFSIAEGSRGYPQLLEYFVVPSTGAGVRLMVNEYPYTGPASAEAVCQSGAPAVSRLTQESFVIADHLASCTFSYHRLNNPGALLVDTGWMPVWDLPVFPPAVRVEMVPLPDSLLAGSAALPFFNVTVPLRTDREFTGQYAGP